MFPASLSPCLPLPRLSCPPEMNLDLAHGIFLNAPNRMFPHLNGGKLHSGWSSFIGRMCLPLRKSSYPHWPGHAQTCRTATSKESSLCQHRVRQLPGFGFLFFVPTWMRVKLTPRSIIYRACSVWVQHMLSGEDKESLPTVWKSIILPYVT